MSSDGVQMPVDKDTGPTIDEIDPALIMALQELGDVYGPLGVRRTADLMWNKEPKRFFMDSDGFCSCFPFEKYSADCGILRHRRLSVKVKYWWVEFSDRNNDIVSLRNETLSAAMEVARIGFDEDDWRRPFVYYDSHERGRS